MALRIEKFSVKRLGRRRQYHARIVCADNALKQWRTSEGYNNRGERDAAIIRLEQAGLVAHVVDLDLQP